jgi:hypothetical protein
MRRVKFEKGKQKKFIKEILDQLNCPSLRDFTQFGFGVPYSTMKNYFNESRNIPESLFKDMCYLAKIDHKKFRVKYLEKNWGQIKGGKTQKK